MAINPPAADVWQSQPSIIIDPSIYVADASSDPLRTRVLGALGTMVWATAAGLVISVTVFAITLSNGWLVHGINHDPSHTSLNFELGQGLAPAQVDDEASAPAVASGTPSGPSEGPKKEPVKTLDPLMIEAAPAVLAPLTPTPRALDEQSDTLIEIQALVKDAHRHMKLRLYDEAEASYRAILALRPNHPGALSGLSRIKLAHGELDPALVFARRAVSIAPAHAVYHAVLGDVLRASGESAAADLEYELASRLSQGGIDRVAKALPENPYALPAQPKAAQGSEESATSEQPAASKPELDAEVSGPTE